LNTKKFQRLILLSSLPLLLAVTSCTNFSKKNTSFRSNTINQLEKRILKLENGLKNEFKDSDNKNKSATIKSLTFRLGTEDDRLRIYWSNGMKTDLPCTKEQNIWACG